jgi:CubicO group peptidase (beta-lactamase class C family)
MILDELDTEWRAANEAAATTEQREQLIAATRRRVNRLWGQIFRRDVIETIAAAFVIIFFGRYLLVANHVVRASAWCLVLWALAVVYKMHRTRTVRKPASPDAPVREFCRIELDRLERQIQLLRGVLWWYIAPCVVGVNAFFIGQAGFGIASVVYGIVTLLLAWGIFRANMKSVATELAPRRNELASLLSQLDDAGASPSSAETEAKWETRARLLGASAGNPLAAAKSTVVMAKSIALVALIFCLLVAFGLMISQAVVAFDSVSLCGYFIYCVVALLLARGIYRAKPVNREPAGWGAAAIGAFNFTVLVVVIVFLMALTLVALGSGAFDSGYLIFCVVMLPLVWGLYRAKSIARASVTLLLAALAFIALAGGLFHFSFEGTPRSDGTAGKWLAGQITELRKENKLVGLAAMVMVDGKVMASAADGERKIKSGVPIELGDRWHLGSITKSVTATMIARLVESGQMKWTDTVGERFSEAAIHEDWKPVTLEQLLTHTSGASANFSLAVRLTQPALGTECTRERRKAVVEVMAEKPAQPPGKKFAYSNVGYTIAGAMAESATGVSWEDLAKREVFEPLELQDAGFGPPKSPSETLEQPRGHKSVLGWKVSAMDGEDNTPIMGPCGTVHMTLGNLCQYATEHLRGELGSGKLLAAETYQRLHKPVLQNYACGWVVKQPTKEIPHTAYWHNGSNTMWYALVVFIPEKNMVVAVTSNDGDIKAAESAAWKIVNACANQFNVEDAARRKSLPSGD